MSTTVFDLGLILQSSVDQTADYTSASATPTNGRVVRVAVLLTVASGNPDTPTLNASNGVATWNQMTNQLFNGGVKRLTTFWGYAAGGYSASALTVHVSGGTTHTGCLIVSCESDNTDLNNPNTHAVTTSGSSTTPSITISSPSVVGSTIGFIATGDNQVTPGSGYTELHERVIATPTAALNVQWQQAADSTIDGTTSNVAWAIAAIEVAEATAGQPTTKRYAGQPFAGVRAPQFHRGIWRF